MSFIRKRVYGVIAAFISVTVNADPFGTVANPKADNKNHFVCWQPYLNEGRVAPEELNNYLAYVQDTVYPVTGVWVYPYPCVDLVDAIYNDDFKDSRYLGIRLCNKFADETLKTCYESEVKINPARIEVTAKDAGVSASALRQSTWCHETGHTFGLPHAEDGSCLTETAQPYLNYSSHQLLHLYNDL